MARCVLLGTPFLFLFFFCSFFLSFCFTKRVVVNSAEQVTKYSDFTLYVPVHAPSEGRAVKLLFCVVPWEPSSCAVGIHRTVTLHVSVVICAASV